MRNQDEAGPTPVGCAGSTDPPSRPGQGPLPGAGRGVTVPGAPAGGLSPMPRRHPRPIRARRREHTVISRQMSTRLSRVWSPSWIGVDHNTDEIPPGLYSLDTCFVTAAFPLSDPAGGFSSSGRLRSTRCAPDSGHASHRPGSGLRHCERQAVGRLCVEQGSSSGSDRATDDEGVGAAVA